MEHRLTDIKLGTVVASIGEDHKGWEPGKQPARSVGDGAITVRVDGNYIVLSAVQDGTEDSLVASPYNAFRLWAALGMILGVELPENTEIEL